MRGYVRKLIEKEPRPTVAFDCGYEELMNEQTQKGLISQFLHAIASNNKSQSPMKLAFTSLQGKQRELFEERCQVIFMIFFILIEVYE